MIIPRGITILGLIGIAALVGISLVLVVGNRNSELAISGASGSIAKTYEAPVISTPYLSAASSSNSPPANVQSNLVGMTDAQFSLFAQQWAIQHSRPLDTPQVLMARAIGYDEIPALGLGCPPNFNTIEEPPLMLAILKGEFDFRQEAPGFQGMPAPVPGKKRYVAYIFDAWAGIPAMITASEDGAAMKKALNDPSLPDSPQEQSVSTCATPLPVDKRHLHYGQEAPGFVVPTHDTVPMSLTPENTPIPPSTAVPVGTIIPVTATPGLPSPLPTLIEPLTTPATAP